MYPVLMVNQWKQVTKVILSGIAVRLLMVHTQTQKPMDLDETMHHLLQ